MNKEREANATATGEEAPPPSNIPRKFQATSPVLSDRNKPGFRRRVRSFYKPPMELQNVASHAASPVPPDRTNPGYGRRVKPFYKPPVKLRDAPPQAANKSSTPIPGARGSKLSIL